MWDNYIFILHYLQWGVYIHIYETKLSHEADMHSAENLVLYVMS